MNVVVPRAPLNPLDHHDQDDPFFFAGRIKENLPADFQGNQSVKISARRPRRPRGRRRRRRGGETSGK